jgi:hypothetical protein
VLGALLPAGLADIHNQLLLGSACIVSCNQNVCIMCDPQVLLQVSRTDLLECNQTSKTTNANGTVSFSSGTLALYTLNPGAACKDRTTGQAIRYASLWKIRCSHACFVSL